MSLETLLEAAEFIDCERDNNADTRGNDVKEFHPYAKTLPNHKYGQKPPRQRTQSQNSRTDDESATNQLVIGSSLGNRGLHNRLEKNRRAQLKACFEQLKNVLPTLEERKASNLFILKSAVRHIQTLRRQETELEMEMQKVAREKIMNQERITALVQEVNAMDIKVDLSSFMQEEDAHSTSTATADGDDPILSDDDGQSSSTLSTTSTPNTPAFGLSPLKYNKAEVTIPRPPSPVVVVSMQSILNRTLMAATTSVLTSLTGSHQTSTAPFKSVNTGLQLSTHTNSAFSPSDVSGKAQSSPMSSKLSVNQILQQTLQQRSVQQQLSLQHQLLAQQKAQEELKALKPVLLATKVQNADMLAAALPAMTPTSQASGSVPQQTQYISNGHLLLGNMDQLIAGGGTGGSHGQLGGQSVGALLNQGGPAAITKLVSQNEANCDVQSGVQLSSISSGHLSLSLPSPVNTATAGSLCSPPSSTSTAGSTAMAQYNQQQQPPAAAGGPVRTVMSFAQLLPSLYTSGAATVPTATTQTSINATQVAANVLQPALATPTTTQVASITNLGNFALAGGMPQQNIQLAAAGAMNPLITPVQTISQAQLQQLIQASLQQQLSLQIQQQQQKLVSLAASVATAGHSLAVTTAPAPSVAMPPIALNAANLTPSQIASTTALGQFNLSALAPLISPISIVTPSVQLTGLNQMTSQMINAQLGQFPILQQQPTLSFKPLVVLPTTTTTGGESVSATATQSTTVQTENITKTQP